MKLSDLHYKGNLKRKYRPVCHIRLTTWNEELKVTSLCRSKPHSISFDVWRIGQSGTALLYGDEPIELVEG